MKRRPQKQSVTDPNAKPLFPTQLEQNALMDEWLKADYAGPYPLPALDFIVGRIGCEIESGLDRGDIEKDDAYHNPSPYADGITNGELFYSLYITIGRMTDEKDFAIHNLPTCDQQAFGTMLDLAICLFIDGLDLNDLQPDALDLWILHSWCSRLDGSRYWADNNGDPVASPAIEEFSLTDWKFIASSVENHFMSATDIEIMPITMQEQQPHWPNHQEFRKAKAWLLDWARNTRWNSKGVEDEDD